MEVIILKGYYYEKNIVSDLTTCPDCGNEIPADLDLSFCLNCGAALDPEPAPALADLLDQERRDVTVLFADLAGFTTFAENRDSEDIENFVSDLMDRFSSVIEDAGGTVDKIMVDTMMAVFGAPEAHEDDPARAISAALRMRELLSTTQQERDGANSLSLRAGLNTGEAIWGEMPDGKKTVLGDEVNRAERLKEGAEPGSILVSKVTRRRASDRFRFEEEAPFSPEALEETIQPFRVTGENVASDELQDVGGIQARMVGREAEFGRLTDTIATAKEKDDPEFVLITGAAGVGKSRMIYELENHLAEREASVQFLKGRCPSGSRVPFGPLREIVHRRAGLDRTGRREDQQKRLRETLEKDLQEIDHTGTEITNWTHLLGDAIGIPFSEKEQNIQYLNPEEQRGELFVGVRKWIRSLSRNSPVIWVFEDLHESDASTRALVADWMEVLEDVPFVLVGTARPDEMEEAARDLLIDSENVQQMSLSPLTAEDTAAVAESALGTDAGKALRDFLAERAGGNPYFIEELLRYLLQEGYAGPETDSGGITYRLDDPEQAREEVPTRARSVMAARLDRLGDSERTVAKTGSVVGRTFWRKVIEDLLEVPVDRSIKRLIGAEIVFETDRVPVPAEEGYIFKHMLLRDTAYGQLLNRQKQELHEMVASWMVDHVEEFTHQTAARLAEHYDRAENDEQALKYYRKAGKLALGSPSAGEAPAYFERAHRISGNRRDLEFRVDALRESGRNQEALEILDDVVDREDPDTVDAVRLLRKTGNLRQILGDVDGAEATRERALEIIEALPEPRGPDMVGELIRLLLDRAEVAGEIRGDLERAQQRIERAEECLEEVDLDAEQRDKLVADVAHEKGKVENRLNNLDTARSLLQKSRNIYERRGDRRGLGDVIQTLGILHDREGDRDQALTYYKEVLRMSRKTGRRNEVGRTLSNIGTIYSNRQKEERALSYFQQALEIHRETGNRRLAGGTEASIGVVFRRKGDFAQAISHFEKALEIYEDVGDRRGTAIVHGYLGSAHLQTKNLDRAREEYEKHLDIAREIDSRRDQGIASANIGIVLKKKGDLEEAETYYEEALKVHEETGYSRGRALVLMNLGNILMEKYELEQAQQNFRQSQQILEEIESLRVRCHLFLARAGLFIEKRNRGVALEQISRARELAREMGFKTGESGEIEVVSKKGTVHRRAALNRSGETEPEPARNDIEEAICCHREALELSEKHEAGPQQIGGVHDELVRDYTCFYIFSNDPATGDHSDVRTKARRHLEKAEHLLTDSAGFEDRVSLRTTRVQFEHAFGDRREAKEEGETLIEELTEKGWQRRARRLARWLSLAGDQES